MPVVGWAVGIGAALVDYYYIMPALKKKPGDRSEPERLLDAPIGSNDVGAPRVWAIGTRIRVPTHIMFQDSKTREETSGSTKAGTQTSLRRVIFDAALALNDRPTQRLVTLYGNGRLMLFRTRNQLQIRTHLMTVTLLNSDQITLTMADTLQPAFTEKFKLGDYVQLRDWVQTAGTPVNLKPFEVTTISDHSSTTPSSIGLTRRWGWITSNMSSVSGLNAGTAFQPAALERIDDRLYCDGYVTVGTNFAKRASHLEGNFIFVANEPVVLRSDSSANAGGIWFPNVPSPITYRRTETRTLTLNNPPPAFPYTGVINAFNGYLASQNGASIGTITQFSPLEIYGTGSSFYFGVFAESWNPDAYYYTGSDTQLTDPILDSVLGTANVPAYRGLSYQVLDGFVSTLFGDQLPYSCEAILEVDNQMDWPQAIETLLRERGNLLSPAIDVNGVTSRPFQGYFLRGAVPCVQAIQPLLIAGQITVQDRDGVLAFSEFRNADSVAIDNGAVISHFGTRLDGDKAADDKWTIEDKGEGDLPKQVNVRHQDADNLLLAGMQSFGLRSPESTDEQNEQDVDLRQLVMTRREATNLAATMLRRAWVNRRTYRFVLPAAYLHLLESDLVTWTDDEGRPHVARIIQRDVGNDFRVSITALAEDLDLTVAGSPAQSASSFVPGLPGGSSGIETTIVDAPAVTDSTAYIPGLHIAIDHTGGQWAGAAVYESTDGTNFDLVGTTDKRSVVGTSEAQLDFWPSAETIIDPNPLFSPQPANDFQAIVWQFSDSAASRVLSTTQARTERGSNWAAIVAPGQPTEIVSFRTVTALGGGRFTIQDYYRGLRGTTPQTWPAGAKMVLLDGSPFWREFVGEITPTALAYKIVPAGLTLDDVEPISVVNQRRNASPLPVRQVNKVIDTTSLTARFTVKYQWCRQVLPYNAQPPHPMDEEVESYRFTIYDPTGTQVRRVRTITASLTGSNSLRDRWIDYTSAQQSADGYTPGTSATFWVDVQQVGKFGLSPSRKGLY
ncbi:MAG: hypothetical protein INH34_15690 [Phycisphaerales bacterium]|nr:hypothetical protein [Phycisphaerales bacterium]